MPKSFTYGCEVCGEHEDARWNGEHYLVPFGWVNLVDQETGFEVDMQLCRQCKPETIETLGKSDERKLEDDSNKQNQGDKNV